MKRLPFVTYPSLEQEITLEEVTYKFLYVWNTRGEFWTLTIKDIEENVILAGVRLVLNVELLQKYNHLAIPQGMLFIIDTDDNNKTEISYSDFENTRQLNIMYIETSEL